jgi:hypothetical protein
MVIEESNMVFNGWVNGSAVAANLSMVKIRHLNH